MESYLTQCSRLVGVSLFSGVVELEMDRRQNPLKARGLVLQMADMMSALLVHQSLPVSA